MKKRNIPIFVPHAGCPHRCCFCDQRVITGTQEAPRPDQVSKLLTRALAELGCKAQRAEIAFFGGSFTAIEPDYMLSLLKAAHQFVGSEAFSGIRVSTRPDAVSPNVLDTLTSYGVTTVELGAQSMDNEVLRASCRGHKADDTAKAAGLIKSAGISLGLQMMTGLPGDNPQNSTETARQFIRLGADMVRIYPTVVLRGSKLEQMYLSGDYTPQTLEQAALLSAELLMMFEQYCIPVIKLGLHAGLDGVVAGPYHPAFRQLCEGQIMLSRLLSQLPEGYTGDADVLVHPADLSIMTGQSKRNTLSLLDRGIRLKVLQDTSCKRLCPRVVG